jgi:hypothetical protein
MTHVTVQQSEHTTACVGDLVQPYMMCCAVLIAAGLWAAATMTILWSWQQSSTGVLLLLLLLLLRSWHSPLQLLPAVQLVVDVCGEPVQQVQLNAYAATSSGAFPRCHMRHASWPVYTVQFSQYIFGTALCCFLSPFCMLTTPWHLLCCWLNHQDVQHAAAPAEQQLWTPHGGPHPAPAVHETQLMQPACHM